MRHGIWSNIGIQQVLLIEEKNVSVKKQKSQVRVVYTGKILTA